MSDFCGAFCLLFEGQNYVQFSVESSLEIHGSALLFATISGKRVFHLTRLVIPTAAYGWARLDTVIVFRVAVFSQLWVFDAQGRYAAHMLYRVTSHTISILNRVWCCGPPRTRSCPIEGPQVGYHWRVVGWAQCNSATDVAHHPSNVFVRHWGLQ